MIDRTDASRALAKVIAYDNAGRPEQAREWARRLCVILERADVLAPIGRPEAKTGDSSSSDRRPDLAEMIARAEYRDEIGR